MVLKNQENLREITRKTLLYKSEVEYAGFALNHAEGCSHGCNFPCYAMMLKKRCGKIKDYDDWIKPRIVSNALELLEKEVPRLKHKIGYVFMCFTTDPFMYQIPQINDLSLKIIERLNRDQIKVVTISKGLYPDALNNKEIYGADNEYGTTVVSLSESFRKKYEPYTSPIEERICALKKLHEKGLKTWVSMEPYPTPNIIKQDISEMLEAISFVDKIVFGKWNYNKLISSYKNRKEFFNSTAVQVLAFCKSRGIQAHIKDGTMTSTDEAKTRNLAFYVPKQHTLFGDAT